MGHYARYCWTKPRYTNNMMLKETKFLINEPPTDHLDHLMMLLMEDNTSAAIKQYPSQPNQVFTRLGSIKPLHDQQKYVYSSVGNTTTNNYAQ